jgi:protein SCO1/2
MVSRRLITSKRRGPLWLLLALLSPVDLYAHVDDVSQTVQVAAPPNSKAPDFTLLNQEGERFVSTTLRGKIVVLDFIYTTCTDVCPLFTANFAQLQRTLKNENKGDVFFISITTDPEVDSPKVLKAYARRYGADFQSWAFLTGTEAQLKEVWKGFGIRVIKKGRGLIQHTGLTTVIDPRGMRRFNYFGDKWQTNDVLNDMSTLLDKKATISDRR